MVNKVKSVQLVSVQHFIYFNFISFALKNTKKKKHCRYANTSNNNVTIHYTDNNLNIWAGTPQQLNPITADPKNKTI